MWTHQVGSDGVPHLRVHVHVHVQELRQVEVHLAVGEAEEAVSDVRLHPRLLGLVQVRNRHGDVKQLGLEEAQQPGLFGRRLRGRLQTGQRRGVFLPFVFVLVLLSNGARLGVDVPRWAAVVRDFCAALLLLLFLVVLLLLVVQHFYFKEHFLAGLERHLRIDHWRQKTNESDKKILRDQHPKQSLSVITWVEPQVHLHGVLRDDVQQGTGPPLLAATRHAAADALAGAAAGDAARAADAPARTGAAGAGAGGGRLLAMGGRGKLQLGSRMMMMMVVTVMVVIGAV